MACEDRACEGRANTHCKQALPGERQDLRHSGCTKVPGDAVHGLGKTSVEILMDWGNGRPQSRVSLLGCFWSESSPLQRLEGTSLHCPYSPGVPDPWDHHPRFETPSTFMAAAMC